MVIRTYVLGAVSMLDAARKRDNSYQVLMYAGIDPLTGKELRLTGTAHTETDARALLKKFRAQVDSQKSPRTKSTLGAALDAWLEIHEVEESTLEGYQGYIDRTIRPALGDVEIAKVTPQVLETFYAQLRKCRVRCRGRIKIDHRVDEDHDCREVRHKRRPGRPPAGGYPPHDCEERGCVVLECKPHVCQPMSPSTIRQIHWILSAALAAAVRWDWISSNPASVAKKPRQPTPQPEPPSPAEAAQLIDAAFRADPAWGMFVWLVMVTGMRRAEVLALRWSDVDVETGRLSISRNYVKANGLAIEKDTKTHQARRIGLDAATVELLVEHRQQYEDQLEQLQVAPTHDAFLFSSKPTHDAPWDPSWVTHRYSKMCGGLHIDSHLHALRHYSATELLTAGVDLRTIAGRLGHAGGGTTTLRVYAAWVGESLSAPPISSAASSSGPGVDLRSPHDNHPLTNVCT